MYIAFDIYSFAHSYTFSMFVYPVFYKRYILIKNIFILIYLQGTSKI